MSALNLLSMEDLPRAEILELVQAATALKVPTSSLAQGRTAGLFFFEASTRTRVGFEAAMLRLGGSAVAVTATKSGPTMSAPETWTDTVRSVGRYFDVLCVRSAEPAAPSLAAALLPDVPVINCGNGHDEHPTQAMIDILAISEIVGGPPDGLHVALVGDLLGMRAAHSLLLALARFRDVLVTAISPPGLSCPERYSGPFRAAGNRYVTSEALTGLAGVNIVYVAGFPPRTEVGDWSEAARAPYRVTADFAATLPASAAILCPLPRVDEIEPAVDDLPQARYFLQSELGLPMRMAVLQRSLVGKDGAFS